MGEARGTEVLYYETKLARTINERLNDPNQAVERPFYKILRHGLIGSPSPGVLNEEADMAISDQ